MNNINAKKAFLSKLQNYKKFFILSKYSWIYLPPQVLFTNIFTNNYSLSDFKSWR